MILQKVQFGGMFWLKSEPFLQKIPTLTFSPPPAAAGRKNLRLAENLTKNFASFPQFLTL